MSKFLAAVIQLDSQDDVEKNLKTTIGFIGEAAQRGAKFIAMPEHMNYCGPTPADYAEEVPGGRTFRLMAEQAKKYNVWLHCGSIVEKNQNDSRPYNCSMVINPRGELVAKYHKLHPFDVAITGGITNKESDRICPGDRIVTVDTDAIGHLGLSICYDLRFCEIYRIMALAGAQILMVPANFTINTGKDHWESLLRARAIENECYVVAPAQTGIKPRFQSNANSMIVDPWGNVIARASSLPQVITAVIDLDYVEQVRKQTFTLANRRPDVYTVTYSHT